MEKKGIVLFIPYIVEFILKIRSRLKAECFGVPDQNNLLKPPYERIYSVIHIVLKYFPRLFRRNLKEYEVVFILYLMEIVFAYIAVFVV